MKRKLYNWFVPNSVKNMLYNKHVQQYLQVEQKRRSESEATLPHSDLSSMYIQNLKVITNKSELLKVLPRQATVVVVGNQPWEFLNQILIVTQPIKLYLLISDLGANIDVLRHQFRVVSQSNRIEFIVGKPVLELEKLEEQLIDWIYLDNAHSFLEVSGLLEISRKKVTSSGFITGGNYTVGDWISSQRFGVIEAVNTFCKKYHWELVYLTNESSRFLSYAIRKIHNQ